MSRISFFSNKVAHKLFKMGWETGDLAPIMSEFKLICDGLKANGYDAGRAARLWSDVLSGKEEAVSEMRANAGIYGAMYLASDDEERSPSPDALPTSSEDIGERLAAAVGLFESMYPDAPPEGREFILGEAISYLFFTSQAPKKRWADFVEGTEDEKLKLSVEAVPFSYMSDKKLPGALEEYLGVRDGDGGISDSLREMISSAMEVLPEETEEELIADAKAHGVKWAESF
jgi:hypothetical protein